MKKVIILIDGANLFYGLKGMSLLEKDIRWDLLLSSLLEANDELVRTYWFRPQKILDTWFTHKNIRRQVCKTKYPSHFPNYKTDPSTIPESIKEEIERESIIVENWIKAKKTSFSEIEYSYDELCLQYSDIEMVKSGVLKIDPYKKILLGEKGVDIALAVKMISLSVGKKCDKIVLISGDYDYAEAIKFVKDNMTKIHIVKLHAGTPPMNKSVSRDLAVIADKVVDVYETDIRTKFSHLTSHV